MNNARPRKRLIFARGICFISLLVSFWIDPTLLLNLERATFIEALLLIIAILAGAYIIWQKWIDKKARI
ncbi:MAG: hypothetical protein H6912_06465 [Kordiimonadaceae bacterium]|nr:hypothetical protein [Kordiimonadaceae bacterium]